MQSGKYEHFRDNCNWCIPVVDNWGINAIGYCGAGGAALAGNNSPGWLKYGLELMGFLSSHPPRGDSGEVGGVIR